MQAGQLKHTIDIQIALNSQDSYGAPAQEWVTFLSGIRASVEPGSGREFFAAQQVNSELTHLVKMRYRVGIKSEMRIKFGNRYFDIKESPKDVKEANRELHLMCRELIP